MSRLPLMEQSPLSLIRIITRVLCPQEIISSMNRSTSVVERVEMIINGTVR